MKKIPWLVALAIGLTGTASAATLSNVHGQSCGDFTGTWHFVNNQTAGAPQGTFTGNWSSGDTCSVSASKVNASNQHFYCVASGALLSGSTNLPGRLVLSDFSCDTIKPPPCDPKTDPNCK